MCGQKMFYTEDGSVTKVGRNDPCPCGSGKKYKSSHPNVIPSGVP